jgi:hypothetical protein
MIQGDQNAGFSFRCLQQAVGVHKNHHSAAANHALAGKYGWRRILINKRR